MPDPRVTSMTVEPLVRRFFDRRDIGRNAPLSMVRCGGRPTNATD